jgi:hypothetical protein
MPKKGLTGKPTPQTKPEDPRKTLAWRWEPSLPVLGRSV